MAASDESLSSGVTWRYQENVTLCHIYFSFPESVKVKKRGKNGSVILGRVNFCVVKLGLQVIKKKKKEVNVSYFMGFVVERDRFD